MTFCYSSPNGLKCPSLVQWRLRTLCKAEVMSFTPCIPYNTENYTPYKLYDFIKYTLVRENIRTGRIFRDDIVQISHLYI